MAKHDRQRVRENGAAPSANGDAKAPPQAHAGSNITYRDIITELLNNFNRWKHREIPASEVKTTAQASRVVMQAVRIHCEFGEDAVNEALSKTSGPVVNKTQATARKK